MFLQRVLFGTIMLLLPFSLVAEQTPAPAVEVSDVWSRATSKSAKAGAVFMTLTNTSDAAQALTKVTGDVAMMIELHTHIEKDGVMAMREVPQIAVPAQERVALKPGGLHVMLMGLNTEGLTEGESFEITLHFETGAAKTITVPIKAAGAQVGHEHDDNKKHDDGHQHHDH